MSLTKIMISDRCLRVALAQRGWTAWQLAAQLGICPSTLSAYRRGRRRLLDDFVVRMERVLELDAGTLNTKV